MLDDEWEWLGRLLGGDWQLIGTVGDYLERKKLHLRLDFIFNFTI